MPPANSRNITIKGTSEVHHCSQAHCAAVHVAHDRRIAPHFCRKYLSQSFLALPCPRAVEATRCLRAGGDPDSGHVAVSSCYREPTKAKQQPDVNAHKHGRPSYHTGPSSSKLRASDCRRAWPARLCSRSTTAPLLRCDLLPWICYSVLWGSRIPQASESKWFLYVHTITCGFLRAHGDSKTRCKAPQDPHTAILRPQHLCAADRDSMRSRVYGLENGLGLRV